MNKLFLILALPVLLLSGGCASIVSGTSQTLAFDSNPQGADCTLTREEVRIGSTTTPGSVVVQKDKHDILVVCNKDGYHEASNVLDSDVEGMTFGNLIIGGVVGWIIDSSTGADNKYDEHITVTLLPDPDSDDADKQKDGTMSPTIPMARKGTYSVVLANFRDEATANTTWASYVNTYPKLGMAKAQISTESGAGGSVLYNLSGTGLSEEDSQAICDQMREQGDYCQVTQS